MKKPIIFITSILMLLVLVCCETPTENETDRTTTSGDGRGTIGDSRYLPQIFFSTPQITIKEAFEGMPTTISFEVKSNNVRRNDKVSATIAFDNSSYPAEMRATEGTHFTTNSQKTLTFDNEHRSHTIAITIIDNELLTVDHYFDIVFTDTISCITTTPNRLSVKIIDDENPINMLCGKYNATAQATTDNSDVDEEYWEASITHDEIEGNLLNIHPICTYKGIGFQYISPVQASVNLENQTLEIEYGQELFYSASTDNRYVFTGVTANNTPITEGSAVATFYTDETGKIVIEFHDNVGITNLTDHLSPIVVKKIENLRFEMK